VKGLFTTLPREISITDFKSSKTSKSTDSKQWLTPIRVSADNIVPYNPTPAMTGEKVFNLRRTDAFE
jgi:hypothetical protein